MTKLELINYVKDRVFQNNTNAITGKKNQEALLQIIEDSYNEKTVKDVSYVGQTLTIMFTDSTTKSYTISGGGTVSYASDTGSSSTIAMHQLASTTNFVKNSQVSNTILSVDTYQSVEIAPTVGLLHLRGNEMILRQGENDNFLISMSLATGMRLLNKQTSHGVVIETNRNSIKVGNTGSLYLESKSGNSSTSSFIELDGGNTQAEGITMTSYQKPMIINTDGDDSGMAITTAGARSPLNISTSSTSPININTRGGNIVCNPALGGKLFYGNPGTPGNEVARKSDITSSETVTVVQYTGTSTTSVMSQKASTESFIRNAAESPLNNATVEAYNKLHLRSIAGDVNLEGGEAYVTMLYDNLSIGTSNGKTIINGENGIELQTQYKAFYGSSLVPGNEIAKKSDITGGGSIVFDNSPNWSVPAQNKALTAYGALNGLVRNYGSGADVQIASNVTGNSGEVFIGRKVGKQLGLLFNYDGIKTINTTSGEYTEPLTLKFSSSGESYFGSTDNILHLQQPSGEGSRNGLYFNSGAQFLQASTGNLTMQSDANMFLNGKDIQITADSLVGTIKIVNAGQTEGVPTHIYCKDFDGTLRELSFIELKAILDALP